MSEATRSRVARDLVNRYGRLPAEPGVRHGSEEVARRCRCEVCRRAFPDKKKRDALSAKAKRSNACAKGAARGHTVCEGWRFAAGVNADTGNYRGAAPCECPCHTDGRGITVPTFEEYLRRRAEDRAAYLRAREGEAS